MGRGAKKGEHRSPATEIKPGERLSPATEFKKGHPTWNKGMISPPRVVQGYFRQWDPDLQQYRMLHRMIVEGVLGRALKSDEIVHHLNGDKLDNRNKNLIVVHNWYHKWFHNEMSRRYAQEHFA